MGKDGFDRSQYLDLWSTDNKFGLQVQLLEWSLMDLVGGDLITKCSNEFQSFSYISLVKDGLL